MSIHSNPQAGPAIALAWLLTDHPDLLPLRWSVSPDGFLAGSAMDLPCDPRPLMDAFVAVLGGRPQTVWSADGSCSSWLPTRWRDVELSVTLGCAAGVLAPLLTVVAA